MNYLTAPLLAFLLFGCASEPEQPAPPPPPTHVEISLQVDKDLNLDASGNPAPVVFRIYQLKDLNSFNNADFFTLLQNDQTALGASLVAKQELLLKIGANQTLDFDMPNEAHALSFFASFKQLDNAQWRVSREISGHQSYKIQLKLTQNKLAISQFENVKPAETSSEH
jgi:type VI secretion system protein VasD